MGEATSLGNRDAAVSQAGTPMRIGVVAIGRNEGERLVRCLRSVLGDAQAGTLGAAGGGRGEAVGVVYVDSGSTDGSVEAAHALGAEVVELDLSRPFTAARARNAGLARLAERYPDVVYVQMVDGDCEVVDGWLETAAGALDAEDRLGVVAGRRREIEPEASPWNRLIDMEWDTPVGDARSIGGDAMFRVSAVREAGGYDETLIAGEEPELCVRLRGAGYTVRRLDAEMTRHDAALTSWRQWWKRSKRAGHAYAQGAAMHGKSPEFHNVKQTKSAVVWGLAGPVVVAGLLVTGGVGLLALAGIGQWVAAGLLVLGLLGAGLYGVLIWKVYRYRLGRGDATDAAALYARWCVAGKVPEGFGVVTYWWNRARGRSTRLMEYKGSAGA